MYLPGPKHLEVPVKVTDSLSGTYRNNDVTWVDATVRLAADGSKDKRVCLLELYGKHVGNDDEFVPRPVTLEETGMCDLENPYFRHGIAISRIWFPFELDEDRRFSWLITSIQGDFKHLESLSAWQAASVDNNL